MSNTSVEFTKRLRALAGQEVIDTLMAEFGGETIQIPMHFPFPKDAKRRIEQRDEDIYGEFDGRNHFELAEKYSVSTRAIHDIVKKMKVKAIKTGLANVVGEENAEKLMVALAGQLINFPKDYEPVPEKAAKTTQNQGHALADQVETALLLLEVADEFRHRILRVLGLVPGGEL
uniref:Mor transcription activator domain-containing protein n=1 Tax=Marinobacter nauticus TaxID=2743 RepID=A0A455W6T6_MARNT|nr:hypothetical protein YBY_30250 [Marinobacter nauticus]